jgi:hypothetical protein
MLDLNAGAMRDLAFDYLISPIVARNISLSALRAAQQGDDHFAIGSQVTVGTWRNVCASATEMIDLFSWKMDDLFTPA